MAASDRAGASGSGTTEALTGLTHAAVLSAICGVVWALNVPPVVVSAERPLTAVLGLWTHVSGEHLWGNVVLLVLFSLALGRRTALVFVVGGVMANIVWMALSMPPATGASGGVYAVMGGAAATCWARHHRLLGASLLLVALGMLASGGGAVVAHTTGLISGLVLAIAADLSHAATEFHRSRSASTAGLQTPCGQWGDGGVLEEGSTVAAGREVRRTGGHERGLCTVRWAGQGDDALCV